MNPEMLLVAGVLAVGLGCALLWSKGIARLANGQPLIDFEPRRAVPWDGLGVMAAFAVYLVIPSLAALIGRGLLLDQAGDVETQEPRQMALLLIFYAAAILAAGAAACGLLAVGYRADARDLGWSWRRAIDDVHLGALTFVALAPPIYLLQTLLSLVYDKAHPLVDMARDTASGWFFVAAAFSAVFVAPVVEEFLFRVVLQGWLEKRLGAAMAAPSSSAETVESIGAATELGPLDPENPYAASDAANRLASAASAVDTTSSGASAAAIVVSALVFALFHISHGVAPITLFFLALGLGYLYQRTHRIMPCIVLHMLINATSLTLLWLSIRFGWDS